MICDRFFPARNVNAVGSHEKSRIQILPARAAHYEPKVQAPSHLVTLGRALPSSLAVGKGEMGEMKPDFLYIGDTRDGLRGFHADGIRAQTCVTSPPYWGLRDYGTATWEGGDEACDHVPPKDIHAAAVAASTLGGGKSNQANAEASRSSFREICRKCGAARIDDQIGLEQTLAEYVATMVEVFRIVRDVLADDGTLWLNLGDSYIGSGMTGGTNSINGGERNQAIMFRGNRRDRVAGLKAKDLCGIPWRVAFALQADGWYLRQDIVWHKPNPMPESVTDRCTKAHEYVFLLSKRERYYFDASAIAEPALQDEFRQTFRGGAYVNNATFDNSAGGKSTDTGNVRIANATRNRRSVWTVASEPYDDAHFAVMPTALVEPCILAGSRLGDVVLDPFMGSGTVAKVARSLGRRWIGCELNPRYAQMVEKRAAQLGMTLVCE